MENKKGKILVEIEYKDGEGEKCFAELMRHMNKDIPIVEGGLISKVYVHGFGAEKLIEDIRKRVNDALDEIKVGL